MNLRHVSSSGIDVSEQSGPKTFYNLETHYDDAATPLAAPGATCQDKRSHYVDPVTGLKVENTQVTTATSKPAAEMYYNVDTSYDDVAIQPVAPGTTCHDKTSHYVDPVTVLKVEDTQVTTATSKPAAEMYHNVDTSYDDVAIQPAAPGAACQDKTSHYVDPVLKVEDTQVTTATSQPSAETYYNLDTSYDDVALQPVAFGAYDVTGQLVNPKMTVDETHSLATTRQPMYDRMQYQQLILSHDQEGIVFF